MIDPLGLPLRILAALARLLTTPLRSAEQPAPRRRAPPVAAGGVVRVAPVRRAELELAGGPHAPGTARAAIRQQLGEVLGPRRLDDAQVLVSELVMNSVLHAGACEQDPVVIHMAVAPERVRIEVCDSGPGFDPKVVRGTGGFGVALLRRMAKAWGVSTDAAYSCVWFEIERDDPKPQRRRGTA